MVASVTSHQSWQNMEISMPPRMPSRTHQSLSYWRMTSSKFTMNFSSCLSSRPASLEAKERSCGWSSAMPSWGVSFLARCEAEFR